MVAKVQSATGPVVEVVGHGDRAGDVAETLLRIAHAEILVEGAAGALDRRCVDTLAAAHVVGGAVALEAAVVHAARAAGRVVRSVALDDVILDQRIAGPSVQREIGVLVVVDAVVAGVVDHARAAGIPALAANPVVGTAGPLRAVAAVCVKGHAGTAGVLPERVVVAVVVAGGVVVEGLCMHRACEQAGGAQQRGGGQGAGSDPGHGVAPCGWRPDRRDHARTRARVSGDGTESGRPARAGRAASLRSSRQEAWIGMLGHDSPSLGTADGMHCWPTRRMVALPSGAASRSPSGGPKRDAVRVSDAC